MDIPAPESMATSSADETHPSRSVLRPPIPNDARETCFWTQAYGCSFGLAVASAAMAQPGITVVVTGDTASADLLDAEVEFFAPELSRIRMPDWETLPYDQFSPHQDIISDRLAALRTLDRNPDALLIVPIATLMGRLCPPEYMQRYSFALQSGARLDLAMLREQLVRAGYRHVSQVVEHGEFAVRGSLLDLFPMGSRAPLRLDLFDDEIEAIRRFDPETQRSTDTIESVDMLPAREVPLDEDAIRTFRRAWRAQFAGDPTACPVYQDVSQGNAPAGIEYYLPLFFGDTATLFDYVGADALFVVADGAFEAAEEFRQQADERYEARRHDVERPVLPPHKIYLPIDQLHGAINQHRRAQIASPATPNAYPFATQVADVVPVDARAPEPLARVNDLIDRHDGRILFVADSPGRQETLTESFTRHGVSMARVASWPEFINADMPVAITVAGLERGVRLLMPSISIIAENQLFGERTTSRKRRKRQSRDAEAVIRDLTELNPGAPVVHEDYGVGRYLGLQTLESGSSDSEYLAIEYGGGDKLYVPVLSLHLISRYTGADADHAPMHKLGTNQWEKAKRKAAEKVRDVAAELLEIHARRAAQPGHAFILDDGAYQDFCQGFPFAETPDQEAAIDAVINDMCASTTMDRLACGDVGFGKTEVALRAAHVAVYGGRQVAILVPTTLLAQQHYQTFRDRFADWPVRIELLSRFRSKGEQTQAVKDLAAGTVDIVIGTHKLLQPDIKFKNLGLVVVDEEHRFGVRHKESLKSLRANVDMLTLTATPIPRTLNFAFSGLRDLSLIATPPERRLAVKTFVREWDNAAIREAALREIRRGGQIYLVHNRVEDIGRIARQFEELVPEAKVRVAHGQMRERELEQVMLDFYHRRFNTLVCTTIIETGIDVPTANTIIINRADRFGLAQLHQLRGRVGRSHHRAYAFLVTPPRRTLTADATKRLDAIESLEELGIGFTLATHDLEIRGAGELLGDEQSGQMNEVGYTLYTDLLRRAVDALKAGRTPELDRPLDHGAEIDLHIPARIPDEYLPDVHARLIMYKRIASAESEADLEDLQVEMIDRFGLLPDSVKRLFEISACKLKANAIGIRKVDLSAAGGRIVFTENPNVDPVKLVQLVQSQSKKFRFDGSDTLRIKADMEAAERRLDELAKLLVHLEQPQAA
jgi:transcription-repair coupling factor (superfamily II helicase)